MHFITDLELNEVSSKSCFQMLFCNIIATYPRGPTYHASIVLGEKYIDAVVVDHSRSFRVWKVRQQQLKSPCHKCDGSLLYFTHIIGRHTQIQAYLIHLATGPNNEVRPVQQAPIY